MRLDLDRLRKAIADVRGESTTDRVRILVHGDSYKIWSIPLERVAKEHGPAVVVIDFRGSMWDVEVWNATTDPERRHVRKFDGRTEIGIPAGLR